MATKQIETLTVAGTVSGNGNATVTITCTRLSTNPTAVSVAVLNGDDAAAVAEKVRDTLAYNATINALFAVSGTGADVILTKHIAEANDTSLNIAIANDTCTGLTAVPASANTQAGDGLVNGYTDVSTFKARYIEGTPKADANRDAQIEKVIQGVSRLIDRYCHRVFYESAIDEARYFTADEPHIVFTDDIQSVTSIKTDDDADGTYENTWTTSDYRLMPANATPKNWIAIKPNGIYTFPVGHYAGVEITGKFGFCTLSNVPDEIREACLIQSERIWLRQQAPFGVVGGGEMGQLVSIAKFDPDVELLLKSYVRL